MTELKRCHFYPAKRVWQRLAEPEETAVFEGAEEHFANGIGKFEYPVLLVDRSKDESGREGVLLTPENLYYSAWMTSYYIPVMDIASIEAVTGLLNRGIYVHSAAGNAWRYGKICKGARRFCALSAGKTIFQKRILSCKGKTRYDLLLSLRLHL